MTIWNRLDALAGRAVDRINAETVRVVPKAKSTVLVGTDDPNRTPYEVRAILEITEEIERPTGDGTRNGNIGTMMIPAVTLTIETERLVPPNTAPRKGDVIVAIEREGQPQYTVNSAAPMGQQRVSMVLSRVAKI